MQGTVIKSTGKWYNVKTDLGEIIACRIKGKYRLKDYKLTNPVAVGDRVVLELEKGLDTAMIVDVVPRKNYVLRRSTRQKHYMHLLACNVDQVFIIVTMRQPNVKPGFIDRFLLTTETYEIPTYLIFNKSDIYEDEDFDFYVELSDIYNKIGCNTLLVSAEKGTNIDELKAILKGKTTLISGHSGVGKSSLINKVQDTLDITTNIISDHSGKGMHTTTFAEMYELDFGGSIIDTPGIKEMGFLNMEPIDVAHNFIEFFEYSSACKYGDCLHINEPHCAVKEAVENEEIHVLRYQSYLGIMDEVMEQNHWERQKKW